MDRDLLPSEVNPSRGYIATANNMNLPKDYPYAQRPISFFWFDNARIGRITEHQLSPRADPAQRAVMNVGPAPMSGDVNVVGMAEYDSKTFRTIGGASFRMVLDVGEWNNSVAVNNPGQSGNWTSPHYRDLFPVWHSGQYFPLLYSRSAIERATTQQILLVPGGGQ